jgi:hypothetical protein
MGQTWDPQTEAKCFEMLTNARQAGRAHIETPLAQLDRVGPDGDVHVSVKVNAAFAKEHFPTLRSAADDAASGR